MLNKSKSISYNKLLEIDSIAIESPKNLSIPSPVHTTRGHDTINASITQVDDVLYHKEDLNYHVIDIIKKESRDKRKLRNNKSQSHVSVINYPSSPTITLPNISKMRIRNALSPKASDKNKDKQFINLFDEIGYESPLVDTVPGQYYKTKPPQYSLPTSRHQIVTLIHPEYSYPSKWNHIKDAKDDYEEYYKNKIARKEMLTSFRQFINTSDRLVLSSSLKTLRDMDINRKQTSYKNHKMISNNTKYIKQINKIDEKNKRYIFTSQNKMNIHTSIYEDKLRHDQELKNNHSIRRNNEILKEYSGTLVKLPDETSKRKAKEIVVNTISDRLQKLSLAKSTAILNAASKTNVNIAICSIDGNDYFDTKPINKSSKSLSYRPTSPLTDLITADEEYASSLAMSEYLERSQENQRIFDEDYFRHSRSSSNTSEKEVETIDINKFEFI